LVPCVEYGAAAFSEVEAGQVNICLTGMDIISFSKGCSWASDEGFFFTGACEEYTWELPGHLEDLLGAESYTLGVFKMLPDDSIEFICPLPEGVRFVGQDSLGRSYFYKFDENA